jgi:hypothetical protein
MLNFVLPALILYQAVQLVVLKLYVQHVIQQYLYSIQQQSHVNVRRGIFMLQQAMFALHIQAVF